MRIAIIIYCVIFFSGCSEEETHLFSLLDHSHTGINFKNTLQENETANVLNYSYFYNGGGVAVGDVNNDGLADVLFTGNMVANRLYLNRGNFKFEDITERSGIAKLQGWCTGATMADVNGDGRLDLYICRSADADPERRKNLLFINNGDLTFSESAGQYGLADKGFSTQASFFDYDKDGDLDMFLINHSLQQYASGTYENVNLRRTRNPDFASKLYRNMGGHFADVSEAAGITSNVLSFGLGLAVSDINNDGWLDIYQSNDFNEPDYLFISNGDSTFTERVSECMDETSLYSMGSDFADYNNDGNTDLVTLDMLSEENHLQKMHSGAENFDKFQMLFNNGFYFQYSRNMLQKNNGDGTFSEIGQFAGVSNTDWSWSALFCDLDNDGNKDLFVTNGYAKDFTDMDFIKFNVDQVVKQRRGEPVASTMEVLNQMPSIKLPNYVFRNAGNNQFESKTGDWGLNQNSISAGAAYADLDNDGDMDLVVNNINEEAFIYRNNSHDSSAHFLKVRLKGTPQNINGIGAKVKLFCKGNLYYQEQMPVRGFQSSVDPVLNFGVGANSIIDSAIIIWPDDRFQKLENVEADQTLLVSWENASVKWSYLLAAPVSYFTKSSGPAFVHRENKFNDFSLQSLLPSYLSRQGPCMAKADVNHDGLEDLFVGGAKGQAGQLFTQQNNGQFIKRNVRDIISDSIYEDVDAAFFDADNDGDKDLYIASGGYEFAVNDELLQDRLYVNDGNGNFTRSKNALPELRFSKGCVRPADVDGDGDVDLFISGRLVPGQYPMSPVSKLLLNNSKGIFTNATDTVCRQLNDIGMVTDALWVDINGDRSQDLVIVGEWMPIKIFINKQGRLVDSSDKYIRFPSHGWWNKLAAADFDHDGDVDLAIGNTGLNTQFKVNAAQPAVMYYSDFDGNGSVDPVLCYYINGVSYPAASLDDLTGQLPYLRKKFLRYQDYADAKITDLFTPEQLARAGQLQAQIMETIFLQNNGDDGFVQKKLPQEMQYSPLYAFEVLDVNNDGNLDIIAAGNQSWTRIKFGRYRAGHGVLLLGDGKNNFRYISQAQSGLNIREDVRSIFSIKTGSKTKLFFGVNDGVLITNELDKTQQH